MQTTEHLLALSREAEEKIQDLHVVIQKILDVPVKSSRESIHSELIAVGYAAGGNGDYGHGTAWSACTRIIDQRQALVRLRSDMASEAEILTGIVDDLIGKAGRLV